MTYFLMGPDAVPVIIDDRVLDYVRAHRQAAPTSFEAGGGLFMSAVPEGFVIASATGPYARDWKGRCHYRVDLEQLNHDVRARQSHQQFFVGMWHTHPENRPRPSRCDKLAMRRLFRNNTHTLTAMLMLIVGQQAGLDGLWVGLHDDTTYEAVMVIEGRPECRSRRAGSRKES